MYYICYKKKSDFYKCILSVAFLLKWSFMVSDFFSYKIKIQVSYKLRSAKLKV